MESKLLNGAASPANCARKIAGPFTVFIRGRLQLAYFQRECVSFESSSDLGRVDQLQPASTVKSCAVHFAAASDARKSAMLATSSGMMREVMHCPFIISCSNSGVYQSLIWRSVQTAPGEMALTRMLCGPYSRACVRMRPMTAALHVL